MKKVIIVLSCIFAFAALALWLPDAEAYSNFGANTTTDNCQACHAGVFGAGDTAAHTAHAASVGGACGTCHGGFPAALSNCTKCHVGAGLRQHHRVKGASACTGCHTNPESGGTENTTPPGYAGTALNTCDGSEELFPSFTVSLDNDGDGLTDGADPDCVPPFQAEWEAIAGYLNSYIQSQYVATDDGEAGFLYTPLLYKSRVDTNSDGTVCGIGDDMANRPVLVDNLMNLTTLIPGTSIRNLWKDPSTAYGGMSNTVISAVRAKVIAHREAGFSDDIAVY